MNLARAVDARLLGNLGHPDGCNWADIARAGNAHIDDLARAFRRKQITSADMTIRQRELVHQIILDDALMAIRLRRVA